MGKINILNVKPIRVEEDFGYQKLVIAETDKLPLTDGKPGLEAGTDTERAYQVYLADEPKDLYWLTVKDGRLTEVRFAIQPGESGELKTERIA